MLGIIIGLFLIPLAGAGLALLWQNSKTASWSNIIASGLTLGGALGLAHYFMHHGNFGVWHQQIVVDALNILLILLSTFIAFTTALFSKPYMQHKVATNQITVRQLKFYHCLYQLVIFSVLGTLLSNNIGLLWVGLEAATLATVMLVGLYQTQESLEAAWKYFILCIVGIALALFGTILLYVAVTRVLGPQQANLLWTNLGRYAASLDPTLSKLALVFLLVGYSTKIGLVPLHSWLPDAYAESPAPVTVLLSGLLSNVAFYALLRLKVIIVGALGANLVGRLLIGFGVLSLLVAALFLQRQRDLKRLLSYSSIEHLGLIAIIFGLATREANFIGLLYLMLHALVKSAAFMLGGNIIQVTGSKVLAKIRGLLACQAWLGWGFLMAILALLAVPPWGLFTMEVTSLSCCFTRSPILAAVVVMGLFLAFGGMLRNLQPIFYGSPGTCTPSQVWLVPAFSHLGLALILGYYLPPSLLTCLTKAAEILGGAG